jgi:hypothetical protein
MNTNITYDLSRRGWIRGEQFSMTNPVVLSATAAGEPIVAYENTFNGRPLVHIRSLYQDRNGAWLPGKGASFDQSEIVDVLTKLVERFAVEQPKIVEAPKPTVFKPEVEQAFPAKGVKIRAKAKADISRDKLLAGFKGTDSRPARQKSHVRRSR